MKINVLFSSFLLFLLIACKEPPLPKSDTSPSSHTKTPVSETTNLLPSSAISKDVLYDKVLGMLVGSAIGDAMGAPTEMWDRHNIQVEYGFVSGLDEMVRAPSPEGTWAMNLPAGGTTDDTRWKVLLTEFITQEGSDFYQEKGANPYHFAEFIVNNYLAKVKNLKNVDSFSPQPFEEEALKMAWLQEWALVAKPFKDNDLEAYAYALNHFYGGEVTCAGMLYSPMIGLALPNAAEKAYESAYRLGIFDLGYARDIAGLTAAMTSAAMSPNATKDSVLSVLRAVDPQGFFNSRLVGRSSYRFYKDALYMVNEAKKMTRKDIDLEAISIPIAGKDTLYIAKMQQLFDALDAKNQDMAFHAGEIHLINLTALISTDFDFQKSMEFVVNYGRDNDTVAAITGSILGAFHGFDKLPKGAVQAVLKTNKEHLGIDLEKLAKEMTDFLVTQGKVEVIGGY